MPYLDPITYLAANIKPVVATAAKALRQRNKLCHRKFLAPTIVSGFPKIVKQLPNLKSGDCFL